MGQYADYAKSVLQAAFPDAWTVDDTRIFSFGPDARTGEVDGVIDGEMAVEIGVGSQKQVRASVLDLALHPSPGKLLILVDTPGHSTERSVGQTRAILERLGCSGVVFRLAEDVALVDAAEQLLSQVSDHADLKVQPGSLDGLADSVVDEPH